MTEGLSTKGLARRLGISVKTVENHKTRIFNKLGVHTQAQAVAMSLSSDTGDRAHKLVSSVNP
jgi:DNA-binding CsgD family transcriptional regulator